MRPRTPAHAGRDGRLPLLMATAALPRGDAPPVPVGALPSPYLLFLGDVTEPGYAKAAFGLRDWAGERCVGEYALAGARVTTTPRARWRARR